MNKDIISAIKEIASEAAVFINEPMSKHTTFRIGGPAELFVRPDCLEKVVKIIDLCKKNSIPYQVMGNGSNVLVLDGGIEGVVISLTDNFSRMIFLSVKQGRCFPKLAVRHAGIHLRVLNLQAEFRGH